MKPRPILQGKPASLREKLGAVVAGKPLHHPGEDAFFRDDFEDVQRRQAAVHPQDEPLAMARKLARLFRSDHEKLDKLTDMDGLWNEMEYDAVVAAARGQLEDALAAAEVTIETEDWARSYCEAMLRDGQPLIEDARARCIDSYCRGFVLGEQVVERIDGGEFGGLDTVGMIRRVERSSYRLEEDAWARPSGLQIDVLAEQAVGRQLAPVQRSWLSGRSLPYRTIVVEPDTADWERYLFLTWPLRSNRVAGLAAYGAAWPWYYFLIHLRQWMMVLGERTGTPILVATFTPPATGLGEYGVTSEKVFELLEQIQTNFRGLLPAGYRIEALATGAEGLAQLLLGLAEHCRRMIELAIVRQTVTGGGEAQGGTLGANQTIFAGTFGGLVAAQSRRLGAVLSGILKSLLRLNYGRSASVEVSFESPDPAKEADRRTRIVEGIGQGVIHTSEPWLRAEFGAPPLDDALLSATKSAQTDRERYGLAEVADVASAAVTGGGANTDAVLEIIDRIQDGDLGRVAATAMLAGAMGVTAEQAAAIIEDELGRRGAQPVPASGLAAASAGEAGTGAPDVAEQAMNGAQVTALQGMLAAVSEGTLASEAAVLAILTAFPFLAEARVRAMVTAQAALPRPAAEQPAAEQPAQPLEPLVPAAEQTPEQHADEALAVASVRMRRAVDSLRRFVRPGYDTTRLPPITTELGAALRVVLPVERSGEAVQKVRQRIADSLTAAMPLVVDDGSAARVVDELVETYADPAWLAALVEEFAAGGAEMHRRSQERQRREHTKDDPYDVEDQPRRRVEKKPVEKEDAAVVAQRALEQRSQYEKEKAEGEALLREEDEEKQFLIQTGHKLETKMVKSFPQTTLTTPEGKVATLNAVQKKQYVKQLKAGGTRGSGVGHWVDQPRDEQGQWV